MGGFFGRLGIPFDPVVQFDGPILAEELMLMLSIADHTSKCGLITSIQLPVSRHADLVLSQIAGGALATGALYAKRNLHVKGNIFIESTATGAFIVLKAYHQFCPGLTATACDTSWALERTVDSSFWACSLKVSP